MGRRGKPKCELEAGLVLSVKSLLRILKAESQTGRLPPLDWWRRDGRPKIVSGPGGTKRFIPSDDVGVADFEVAIFNRPRLWLETKSTTGRQSDSQKKFQIAVEAIGDKYVLIRSMADCEAALRLHGIEHWSLSHR